MVRIIFCIEILNYFHFIVVPNCSVKGLESHSGCINSYNMTIMAFTGIVFIDRIFIVQILE